MGIIGKGLGGIFGFMVLASMLGGNHGGGSGIGQASASGDGANAGQKMTSAAFNHTLDTRCLVSARGFSQLSSGMSYDTAARVLGCPGNEMSRSELAGFTTVAYGWDGEGMLGANMNAMFQNGGLVSKAQFGLR